MAEDIKMNVFPQVTNAEYIYGELVDGSQVKINLKSATIIQYTIKGRFMSR